MAEENRALHLASVGLAGAAPVRVDAGDASVGMVRAIISPCCKLCRASDCSQATCDVA